MTKEDNYFDDLFRNKLDGFTETPPAYIWEGIQQTQQAGKRKKLFFYLRLTGAAAAVIIAFFLGRQIAIQPDKELLPVEVAETPFTPETGSEADSKSSTIDPVTGSSAQDLIVRNDKQQIAGKTKARISKDGNGAVNPDFSIQKQQFASLTVGQDQEGGDQPRESFSLLKSLTKDFFTFDLKPEEKQLTTTITENKKSQSLTADDLETIERNQQLLALNEKTKQKHSWQVAAMVAPNLAVNQTSYQETYANNMSNPGSKENLSVGGGLAVSYRAGKRLSVQSGVYYSQLGQSSSNQSISRQSDFLSSDHTANYFNTTLAVESGQVLLNASAGVVELDNLPSNTRIGNKLEAEHDKEAVFLMAAEFQQHFEYVEIPLNLRYLLIDSKIDINLLGGFSSNWLIGNDAYLESDLGREWIGETRDMNKVTYSTSFGIGFDYGISNKISMHLEPQIKYFLGSLNRNSQVSFKSYTIGIHTGLSYRF